MNYTVYKYTKQNEFIRTYKSIADAAKDMNVNESTIRRAAKENKNSCGYIWSYSEIEPKKEIAISKKEKIKSETNFDTANKNILIIGDLHAPFTINGYFDFCKKIRDKYMCDTIVFIGDLVDNHFSSFHDTDPDGHSAAEELKLAKEQIDVWYKEFPRAYVCIGNHDQIPNRQAFKSGVSKYWVKDISDVLETPNWQYSEEFIINDVLYTHGVGRKAYNRMLQDLISIVQGHYHSESEIRFLVGKKRKTFSMQVGCGVDFKSYAMAYGKYFKKMHINCGVVCDDLPILEYMDL